MPLTGEHITTALRAMGAGSGLVATPDAIAALFNQAMARTPGAWDTPEKVAALVGTCAQESAYFRTTEEYAKDGPYAPFIGRTFVQLTHEANYRGFGSWCKALGLLAYADVFVDEPTSLAELRWAALGGVYYFTQVEFAVAPYGPQPLTFWAGNILAVSRAVNLGSPTSAATPAGMPARTAAYKALLALGPAIVPTPPTPAPAPVPKPAPVPPKPTPTPAPVKPKGPPVSDRDRRVTYRGVRTTVRTAKMIEAASAEFTKATGRPAPAISQGGYNAGAVKASAGTHDRDAIDFATASFSSGHALTFEKILGKVGFAGWWRRLPYWRQSRHHHAIPRGGDVSAGAHSQEVDYRNGRTGLVGHAHYPGIAAYKDASWEKWWEAHKPKPIKGGYILVGGKVQRDLKYLTVQAVNRARATRGRNYRESWYVQTWLAGLNLYKGPVDGTWGPVTQAALDKFRDLRRTPDRRGPVTLASLSRLRNSAKAHDVPHSNKHVYEK